MPGLIVWKNQRINRLRKDMDRMFDRICGEFGGTLTPGIGRGSPFIDLAEAGSNLILRAEIPGANPKDLEVEIEEDTLTISGETKQDTVIENESYHRTERSYGSFFILKPASRDSGNGLFYRFHTEAYTTLAIDLQYLDLDDISFSQFIGDFFNTLFTYL